MTQPAQIPDPRITWPAEHAPASAMVFAQNIIDVAASPEMIWSQLVDCMAWPQWYKHCSDVSMLGGESRLNVKSRFRFISMHKRRLIDGCLPPLVRLRLKTPLCRVREEILIRNSSPVLKVRHLLLESHVFAPLLPWTSPPWATDCLTMTSCNLESRGTVFKGNSKGKEWCNRLTRGWRLPGLEQIWSASAYSSSTLIRGNFASSGLGSSWRISHFAFWSPCWASPES
jgi:hypothetical protein